MLQQKMEVEVATTVLYNKYSGVDLPGKDIDFVVVRLRYILCIQ
jgi:co-chaperonin GroES (HSP10)